MKSTMIADRTHFARQGELQDRRPRRGQLKRIAVASCHQGSFTVPLFACDSSCREVIGLISRRLCIGETARSDELRQDVQLIEQVSVELPPSLIRTESPVPLGGHVNRCPNQPTLPAATRFRTTAAENSRSRQWRHRPDRRADGSISAAHDRRDAQRNRHQ
jgi:hypothetical protein